MQPSPEVEKLRADLARQHRAHLRTELDLAKTLFEFARLEHDVGDAHAESLSIKHFYQVMKGARQGLDRVPDLAPGEREAIEAELRKMEDAMKALSESPRK